MSEASSHAERVHRLEQNLEGEVRDLMEQRHDRIMAHLVADAEQRLEARDDSATTHVVWVHTYALARACTMLQWALARVARLELEAAGQDPLFACDIDEADQ